MATPLGNAIRAARLRKGLKQWEIARDLAVTRAAVGQWEAGTNEPTLPNVRKLSELLEIDFLRMSNITTVPDHRLTSRFDNLELILRPEGAFDFPVDMCVAEDDARVYRTHADDVYFYVRRFDFFSLVPNVKAMFFNTNVFSPRYETNDAVYIDPNRWPEAGEYAVFWLKPNVKPGFKHYLFMRKVLHIDASKAILGRLKPERQEEWLLESFLTVATVIPEYDLIRKRGK